MGCACLLLSRCPPLLSALTDRGVSHRQGQIEVDHEALVARIRDILDEVDKGAES